MKYLLMLCLPISVFACEVCDFCDDEIDRIEERIDAIIFHGEPYESDWYWYSRGQIQGYKNVKQHLLDKEIAHVE